MGKKNYEQSPDRQHDERVFREGIAIFTEADLRELINTIYSWYQFKGSQSDKLYRLINFLASENNKYIDPELINQSKRFSDYLDNFSDFLKRNFNPGEQTEDGDILYPLITIETGSETEAFLAEFQLLSLDIENAYRTYKAVIISKLEI
jgi:hypothetical protein